MVYTFRGIATGNLQADHRPSAVFVAKPFTIIATANPGEILTSMAHCAVPSGTCRILIAPATSATIQVDELTATIESPISVFDNQTFPALGLKRGPAVADLLDLQGRREFETYALDSDLWPSGLFFRSPRAFGQFSRTHDCVMTSLGVLTIEWVQNVRVTAVHASE